MADAYRTPLFTTGQKTASKEKAKARPKKKAPARAKKVNVAVDSDQGVFVMSELKARGGEKFVYRCEVGKCYNAHGAPIDASACVLWCLTNNVIVPEELVAALRSEVAERAVQRLLA